MGILLQKFTREVMASLYASGRSVLIVLVAVVLLVIWAAWYTFGFGYYVSEFPGDEYPVKNLSAHPLLQDIFFPRKLGGFLEVAHSPSFNPIDERDWMLVYGLKLKSLPREQKRHVALLKYDSDTISRSGYGFALTNLGGRVYPEVYWRTKSRQGGWFRFSEVGLQKGEWGVFVISYRQGKYLGLHFLSLGVDENDLTLLGGYALDYEGITEPPESVAALKIGDPARTNLVGMFSFVSILSTKKLAQSFPGVVQKLVHRKQLPADWTIHFLTYNGKQDESEKNHSIIAEHVGYRSKSRRSGR